MFFERICSYFIILNKLELLLGDFVNKIHNLMLVKIQESVSVNFQIIKSLLSTAEIFAIK